MTWRDVLVAGIGFTAAMVIREAVPRVMDRIWPREAATRPPEARNEPDGP